jgi:hypothetical protein
MRRLTGPWPLALLALAVLAFPVAAGPTTAGRSAEALEIARASRSRWCIGRVDLDEHDGVTTIEAEMVIDGLPVARVRIDPGATPGLQPRQAVERALPRVEVGTWAWPTDHGRAWAVPLRLDGRVIGTLKVDARAGRILPHRHD